jgi:hypothetical protein
MMVELGSGSKYAPYRLNTAIALVARIDGTISTKKIRKLNAVAGRTMDSCRTG